MKYIFLLLFLFLSFNCFSNEKIKVSCVGNSVTYGMTIDNREENCYPAQLQKLLGDKYDVRNFGKSGATLLRKGHRPYNEQDEYFQAVDFAGDIVIIHLGLNDTDPRNWPNYREEFIADYLALINKFREVNPKCRIFICRMTPISHRHWRFKAGTRDWYWQIQEKIELISEISGVQLINLQEPLYSMPNLLPDALHPNAEGAAILAKKVYSSITGDYGGLSMPITYSDNMVFQRNREIVINGVANAGEMVTVNFGKQSKSAVTQFDGTWSVRLKPMRAAENLKLKIYTDSRCLEYKSVAVGEVWLCSGQSNMAFTVSQLEDNERNELISALQRKNNIRVFNMSPNWHTDNIEWSCSALDSLCRMQYFSVNGWERCNTSNVMDVSAIAVAFGKRLADSLNVPVGIICNAVGGSSTESWIDRKTLEFNFEDILYNWLDNPLIQDWVRERAKKNIAKGTSNLQRHPYEPSYLFETGIMPLGCYDISGVVWYQGESNAHNVEAHEKLFSLLLDSWRGYWKNDCLPFYFVQLSSLNRPSWTWFRDSQRRLAEGLDNCYMAVSSDRGDSLDVHPRRKFDVASRLGNLALCHTYNKYVKADSPCFANAVVGDGRIIITFNNADSLKTSNGGSPITFEIAGRDEQFYSVNAKIVGNAVELQFNGVCDSPMYVRYGWQPFTRANVVNESGLPISTFLITISK